MFRASIKINAILLVLLVLPTTACANAQVEELPTAAASSPQGPSLPSITRDRFNLQPTSSGSQIFSTPFYSYTHLGLDGNRIIPGKGAFPAINPVDIELDGLPQWVLGGPVQNGTVWIAVLETGQIQAFRVVDREVLEIPVDPPALEPGQAPLLRLDQGGPSVVTFPSFEPSPLTHPVPLSLSGNYAVITTSGDVVITDPNSNQMARIAVDALPDARILVDEHDRLLLLTNPTTIYDHGVLGDRLEAASFALIETAPAARIVRSTNVPEGHVIESIAPIWIDIDQDGTREIILTVSSAEDGAQIVIYTEDGLQISAGPAVGQAFRWRHQIAASNFGPSGEVELIDVLTPHIGGRVEFYRPSGNTLKILAQVEGYTSHVIGTRNLDMAVAGDFDGDDQMELLLPNQSRTELGAIRRFPESAQVVWTLPIDGQMVTNLAAVRLPGDSIALGLGRHDHILRLWLP
jgi:hypothetical protein